MGRRLELMWRLRRLRDGAPDAGAPAVIVSPVRALLQRLGPHVEDVEPVQVAGGQEVDLHRLVEELVGLGYRREYQVEHRGELAVRGSIVDVFPSTAAGPVRIDLWGDEVDRLTEFSVADQRSVADIDKVVIFGCRELLPSAEVRQRAAALRHEEPWGTQTWDRLADGMSFDGMESWLPWLTADGRLLVDLLPETAKVLLVEPRRMRERAVEIAEEEADLAGALAVTWGAQGRDFPRLYLPFDRLLSGTGAAVAMLPAAAEGPGTATMTTTGWSPVAAGDGSPDGPAARSQRQALHGRGLRRERRRARRRLSQSLRDEGFNAPVVSELGAGVQVVAVPIERGFICPALEMAVLAESDLTGRHRPHRVSRPRAASVPTFFDDMKTGDYVVHFQHGVARFGGMVKRKIGDVERDYLMLDYRDGDKLYVPSDQVDALRPVHGRRDPGAVPAERERVAEDQGPGEASGRARSPTNW